MTGKAVFIKILVLVSLFFKIEASTQQQPQLRGLTTVGSSELPPPGIEHRPATDVSIEAVTVDYCFLHSQNWIVYSGTYYNSIIGSNVGVSSSTYTSSKNVWTVGITGVPNYDRTFTSANIAALNSRPKASTDFRTGATTAVANTWYAFGSDIGYTTKSCSLGYWPPGPVCPTAQTNFAGSFPVSPALETGTTGCYASGASPGIYVTGVPLWSWSDANSYNNAGIWHNLALSFEPYDMDICMGHAANGQYHHHGYSPCVAEKLGDMGTGHSPIYGFAADGYPMYGPYQAAQTLAKPCWKARDYSSSSTGCSDGTRSCQFKNSEDITQGTTTVTAGPSLTGTVLSLSSNTISAKSGIYFEDYYLDTVCAASAGPNIYLDKNNGHDHGDGLGYHYHITTDSSGNGIFPYGPGPKFHGCLPSTATCCSSATMGGGGSGGGGAGSGPPPSNGPMSGQGCTAGTSVCAATTVATTSLCSTYTPKLTTTPLQGPSSPPTIGPPTLAPVAGGSSSGGASGGGPPPSGSSGGPPPPPSTGSSSGSSNTPSSTSVTTALSTCGATITNTLKASYPGIQVSNPTVTTQSGGASVSVTQNIPAGVTLAQASSTPFQSAYAQAVATAAGVPTTSITGLTATQGRRLLAGVNMGYTIINLSTQIPILGSGSSGGGSSSGSMSSSGGNCFMGTEVVQLASGEHKSIAKVQIGDHILTINAQGEQVFSPVVYKPYGTNEQPTTFTTITTESGRDLTMTANHMLPAGICTTTSVLPFVAAADVAVGNCVQTLSGREQVLSVSKIEGKGIYTIIAMEELIVVNGIVATPFGGINPILANIYYNLHRLMYTIVWDKHMLTTGTTEWLKVALVKWWAVMTSF